MKTSSKIIHVFGVLFAILASHSCRKPNEMPPVEAKYATEIILPEPEDLTIAEREYIDNLKEEYNNSIE